MARIADWVERRVWWKPWTWGRRPVKVEKDFFVRCAREMAEPYEGVPEGLGMRPSPLLAKLRMRQDN